MAGHSDVKPFPAQLKEQMSFYFNLAVNTVVFPTLSPTDTGDIPVMLCLNTSCVDTDKALKLLQLSCLCAALTTVADMVLIIKLDMLSISL